MSKLFKCSVFNPNAACDYSISGDEDKIVEDAARHEMDEHNYEDTPQLREDIRSSLIDEPGG